MFRIITAVIGAGSAVTFFTGYGQHLTALFDAVGTAI